MALSIILLYNVSTKARLDAFYIQEENCLFIHEKFIKLHDPQCRAANSTRSLYSLETKDFTFIVGWPLPFAGDTYFNPITVAKPEKKDKEINLLAREIGPWNIR